MGREWPRRGISPRKGSRADGRRRGLSDCPLPPTVPPWQRMVKNLEKELVLLKQELAVHDSLVRGRAGLPGGTAPRHQGHWGH